MGQFHLDGFNKLGLITALKGKYEVNFLAMGGPAHTKERSLLNLE